MKIIELRAENIKRLKAVTIKPDGDVVFVTGANGAGKSSVLDCITMALKGGKSIPEKPIRNGADKGGICLDLGDYAIKRTFTESGSYLKIEGLPKGKTPQQFLDELVGKISFDPLEFMNEKPEKQAAVFRELVGVDVSDIDEQIKLLTEERMLIGREGKNLAGALDNMAVYADAPAEEISVKTLTDELNAAYDHNRKIELESSRLDRAQDEVAESKIDNQHEEEEIAELEEEIKRRRADLAERKKEVKAEESLLKERLAEHAKKETINISPIQEKINTVDADNSKVRANREYKKIKGEHAKKQEEYKAKTAEIAKLTDEKAERFAQAKMPVPGLSVEDNRVLYNGIPLEQISDGEKLMVSLAISMALNPELRVLRIKDGSLLDTKNLKIIQDMTKENDFQIWIEKVDESGKIGIYIEEGEIKEV